jgi:hypothetical protein
MVRNTQFEPSFAGNTRQNWTTRVHSVSIAKTTNSNNSNDKKGQGQSGLGGQPPGGNRPGKDGEKVRFFSLDGLTM